MNRITQIKFMQEQRRSRNLQVSFHSLREKRRHLSPNSHRRKPRGVAHRSSRCESKFKLSSKIRELVAPKASKKYEIAILIKKTVEDNSVSLGIDVKDYIIDVLRDLIPNKFKIEHETYPYHKRPERIYIKKIYLKHELDLCIVQISIQQYIWRVMRVVPVKSIKSET